MSYLNSKPLIHGVEAEGVAVDYAVPSALLPMALGGRHDLTLLPVADLLRHADVLERAPRGGGIACAGPTWTVRLYSRVPLPRVRVLHADTDSHTSVTLARILLKERGGSVPAVEDFAAARADWSRDPAPEAVLLIGDKVVTDPPPRRLYPIELDLGEAWFRTTGLPFTFAAWVRRRDVDANAVAPLLSLLERRLTENLRGLDALVDRYAPAHGWPAELARDYLGRVLHYRLGKAEEAGIARYAQLAQAAGVL